MLPVDILGRFWSKVDKKTGPVHPTLGRCWIWTACKNSDGYGQFGVGRKSLAAHRLAYFNVNGDIPAGLELDHLCKTRHCVRPDHLEAVVHKDNCRRGDAGKHLKDRTHCPHGHEYSAKNTRWRTTPSGIGRGCKICERLKGIRQRDARAPKQRQRKVVCPNGHPYLGAITKASGRQVCLICRRAARKVRYYARKALKD